MSRIVVVLWLGALGTRAAAQPDLDAWAQARWARLTEPAARVAAPAKYDAKKVTEIETLLDQARIAAASLDTDAALARTDQAKTLLLQHPELPQAAWLMAERHLVEASVRASLDGSDPRAAALRRAARALEGPRAHALGDDDATATEPPTSRVALAVRGLGSGDTLYWDGNRVTPPLQTPAGQHHARVIRGGRLAWAGWLSVQPAARAIALPVPAPAECSRDDLTGVRVENGRVVAPGTLRCPSWIAARPAPGGGVEVASCSGSSCGPLLRWKRGDGAVYSGPPQPEQATPFPVWAAVGAGLGAAMVTTIVLWRSGVFDGPEPGRSRWQYTGPQSSSAAVRF